MILKDDKIKKLFNDFLKWKEDNIYLYNKEQHEVLEHIQNDFIWKNKQELAQFIINYFGERFEQQYFIDLFIHKSSLNVKEIYNSVHTYLNIH